MLFKGFRGKQTVVNPYNGILLHNRNCITIDTCDSWINLKSERNPFQKVTCMLFHLYNILILQNYKYWEYISHFLMLGLGGEFDHKEVATGSLL